MKPQQALQNLYQASRLANLSAENHILLQQCNATLEELIKRDVTTETKSTDLNA